AAAPRPPFPRPPVPPRAPSGPLALGAAADPFQRGPTLVFALSSDGLLHVMYVSNGEEPILPIPFAPANVNARGLIVAGGAAYAVTAQSCGGAPNGLWALDLASKQVNSWRSSGGNSGPAGPAFGPDGTIYLATEGGELVSLEPKTLRVKNSYKSGGPGFASSPVVFEHKGKVLVAAAAKDGRLHLLDASTLSGLHKTPAPSSAVNFVPGALASWQDLDETRWVLEPAATAIVAWKVIEQNGAPALQPGWTSRELITPLPPMVVNGVVFAVSGGAPG